MKRSSYSRRHQQGVALAIALVLLLIMSILGVASLRTSLMEERMSGALLDRGLAFQAAEGALRQAESVLAEGIVAPTFPASGCDAQGFCSTPDPNAISRWNDPAFEGWISASVTLPDIVLTPQYFIEDMGQAPNWPGCDREVPVSDLCLSPRYRITARSGDPSTGRAQTVLQSSYAAP